MHMMGPDDVIEVMNLLRQAEVSAWLDGGWGVDALIGEQTRPHDDIDLVISIQDVARVVETLAPLGFKLNEDELPTRLGLRDSRDRRIDFHTVTFDGEGGGLQQLQDGRTYRYPPEGFGGQGMVAGITLPCLTAEVQVECHLGYEPDETDYHDMRLLADRLGIDLPRPYQRSRSIKSEDTRDWAIRN